MRKFYILLFFLDSSLAVGAKDNSSKEDTGVKIASIVFLIGALILAIWKLKGTYRK